MQEHWDDKCLFNRFQSEIRCSCIFLFGGGEGVFWKGAVFRGRHKGFFGEVGGGNKVVCLKTRTLLTCLLGKKSDLIEFFIWGREFFFLGGGSFLGGDKVLRGKSPESRVQSPESRVQSPESRVQSPGSSPAFRICRIKPVCANSPQVEGQDWLRKEISRRLHECWLHVGFKGLVNYLLYYFKELKKHIGIKANRKIQFCLKLVLTNRTNHEH